MRVNYLQTIPGSERKLVGNHTKEGIDLSKIVLEIEPRIGVQVVRKPHKQEYEVSIGIDGLGHGRYKDGELFFSRKQAIGKRDEILAELKKGKEGKYKIVYRGDSEISLYLI